MVEEVEVGVVTLLQFAEARLQSAELAACTVEEAVCTAALGDSAVWRSLLQIPADSHRLNWTISSCPYSSAPSTRLHTAVLAREQCHLPAALQ